ncbi:MAG TPA: photoactive yellow protein [Planctomycetes bacterium]|nr:photoactive yellow protein [Planctomycetota bacterium]|tara:strand:- start:154 stop:528 length:375 start_codon:yes stop_codon:yes gene_type:complete
MSFVDSTVLESLGTFDRAQADASDFGVVKLDAEGKVLLYNRWESELAGVPVDQAEGKNFFTEVAPCTNNRLVFGRFKKGIEAQELDAEFNYTFTYKMKPTNVVLRLYRDPGSATNWVFVAKNAA